MPGSGGGLLVFLVAVLPGALYIWAFEREVGRWGIGLADRLLRFIGVSALFLALLSYPIHLLWTHYLHMPVTRYTGLRLDLERYLRYYNSDRAHTGRLTRGRTPEDVIGKVKMWSR